VNNFNMTKRAKAGKGNKPAALKPCPNADLIWVCQFQFFDNGPNPGKGKTQHTIKLEVHLTEDIDLYKPHWVRSVALIEAEDFKAWANKALEQGRLTADQHANYVGMADAMIERRSYPDTLWAKCGRIEDKRAHADHPGQFIVCWREVGGPMQCHVVLGSDAISCERFIHDQRSTPGTGRRKAFGFFDPQNLHGEKIAEQIALAEGRPLNEVRAERGLI
jgi:hypothetical protein